MHTCTGTCSCHPKRTFHLVETPGTDGQSARYGLLMEEEGRLTLLPDLTGRHARALCLVERLTFDDVSRYHLREVVEELMF